MEGISLFIVDLDNTIYDWYGAFIPAFYAMVEKAIELLKCDREVLLDELRQVHIRHGDVEHPFSLLETKTVQSLIQQTTQTSVTDLLDPAFHDFNRARKEALRLFPGVLETLSAIRAKGCKIVAHTDSKFFAAVGRLRRLGVLESFDRVYCGEKGISQVPARYFPSSSVSELERVRQLPPEDSKPNPKVLRDIIADQSEVPHATAYVGDSITKDMLMAKHAGCLAIWAKYGSRPDAQMYERLVRISHWDDTAISRERNYREEALRVRPDFVCENSFDEILAMLEPSKAIMGQRI